MLEKLKKANWLLIIISFALGLLTMFFVPKFFSTDNDLKKCQREGRMSKQEVIYLLKIDSLETELNTCQGGAVKITALPKKVKQIKHNKKREKIRSFSSPTPVPVALALETTEEKKEEVNIPSDGVVLRKSYIPKKRTTPQKAVAIKPVQEEQEQSQSNCPSCRTRYGKLGVKY